MSKRFIFGAGFLAGLGLIYARKNQKVLSQQVRQRLLGDDKLIFGFKDRWPFSNQKLTDRLKEQQAAEEAEARARAMARFSRSPRDPNGVLYGRNLYDQSPIIINPQNSDQTIEVTTLLGNPGSGKSFWLRAHINRLSEAGWQIFALDLLGDFNKWFTNNDGQVVSFYPNAPFHVNPLQLVKVKHLGAQGQEVEEWEDIDVKINQRLKPLFQILLGNEYNSMIDTLIDQGLRIFYERYGVEEHLMAELVEIFGEVNQKNQEELSPLLLDQRRRLVDYLKLRLLDGELRGYFESKTNLRISGRVNFDLSQAKDGRQQSVAAYLAATAICNFAATSLERKVILVDDLSRLFRSKETARGMAKTLEDLMRIHRHYNAAVVLASQLTTTDDGDSHLSDLLNWPTTTWILLPSNDRFLETAARFIGAEEHLDLILSLLTQRAYATGINTTARRGLIFRHGERPIPFVLDGSEKEMLADDPFSPAFKNQSPGPVNTSEGRLNQYSRDYRSRS
jgi:hypothetical protein